MVQFIRIRCGDSPPCYVSPKHIAAIMDYSNRDEDKDTIPKSFIYLITGDKIPCEEKSADIAKLLAYGVNKDG